MHVMQSVQPDAESATTKPFVLNPRNPEAADPVHASGRVPQ